MSKVIVYRHKRDGIEGDLKDEFIICSEESEKETLEKCSFMPEHYNRQVIEEGSWLSIGVCIKAKLNI